MAMELIRFLAGILFLLIPGICLARCFSLGNNLLERCTNGSSLGLALAIYLASAASHVDLRLFYPLWACLGVVAVGAWIKSLSRRAPGADSAAQVWILVVLSLVALTRYALALPQQLPPGALDPTFHLILIKKIQLAQHSIDDWLPFADMKLNYPTGSHVLVVVLAAFARLPLHTTFKDLIPFLGILTTAQVYVFARRALGNPSIALYSAAAYGLWAWYGSIDYFRWGGLPNELAMLLFLAMLSLWLDRPGRAGLVAMAVLYASAVLVHHHVMVVSGVILALLVLWQMFRDRTGASWKSLAIPAVAAMLLNVFFLFPYAMRLGSLHATGIVAGGEDLMPLLRLPRDFGYALTFFSLLGIGLCLLHKVRCPPVVAIPSLALAVMFIAGEDLFPLALRAMHKEAFTFFTPSRFLSDLNYFLPIFAGMAVWFLRQKLQIPPWITMLLVFAASVVDWNQWKFNAELVGLPPQFLQACDWIQHNTPPSTIVDNPERWTTYLCWRRSDGTQFPVSEPAMNFQPESERIPLIESGKIPPDAPHMMIVAIRDKQFYTNEPVLWRDSSGLAVIREWPK
ncbi:MAG: hypothetical protein ABSB33_13665 [Tepidisphaeraceae bacterium]|jgi:hypothetical protein